MTEALRRFAIIWMARPGNLLVVGIGVVVGAWMVPGSNLVPDVSVRLAACAAILVAAAANIHNDVVDVEIDAINRPERALPAGRVTLGQAWLAAAVACVGAIVVSSLVSGLHVGAAIGIAVLLLAYNLKLKHMPLLGNIVVGVVVSAAIVFGALASEVGGEEPGSRITSGVLVGALFALLLTVAREVVKDLQDFRGDAELHSRSLPHTAGTRVARWFAWIVVAVTVCVIPLPYVYFGFPGLYLLVVFPAACLLLAVLVALSQEPDDDSASRQYGRSSAMLKLSMVLGLAALALSSPSL